ncbi:hypothetical protein C8R43DRAFT_1167046 [Mycena crocata]|nr:hypothetical protein C8R43DRAFT_1167046 [Mycena crocata]
MNPFSQGWSNSPRSHATQYPAWGTTPSVYGALPTPVPTPVHTTPRLTRFTFVSPPNGTILNSTVNGPQAQTYFRVTTDSTASGFSVVQNARRQSVAVIEWRRRPVVEVYGVVSKRNSAQWLALSADKTHRIMNVRGCDFGWMPEDRYIGLYNLSTSTPQFLGRISQGQEGTMLEITPEGLELGLLETFVASALLLMCGRSID